MKNKILLGLVSLSLLSTMGCGKSVEKVINKATKDNSKAIECGVAETGSQIESEFAEDYDVKLYKATVEKVLADLRVVKYLDSRDFWSFLSDETRNLLNYELNIHLLKNTNENAEATYQATAYFFTAVRDLFKDGTDYKLKDMNRTLYSFSLRGVKSTRTVMVNSQCGKYQKTDLSRITIDDVILKVDSVNDVFECRTLDKSFTLMDGKGMLYLSSNKAVQVLRLNGYKKEINKRNIKLGYEARDVSFDLRINKQKEEVINGWTGHKSKIDLKISELTIDDFGACSSLKNTF
jgi:hypothetical protein